MKYREFLWRSSMRCYPYRLSFIANQGDTSCVVGHPFSSRERKGERRRSPVTVPLRSQTQPHRPALHGLSPNRGHLLRVP